MKANWIVRVIIDSEERQTIGWFLSLLENALYIQIHRYDDDGACFDFLVPYLMEEEPAAIWRASVIKGCELFCWNAVEAPPCPLDKTIVRDFSPEVHRMIKP